MASDRRETFIEALDDYVRAYCDLHQEDSWYRSGHPADVRKAREEVLRLYDEATKIDQFS